MGEIIIPSPHTSVQVPDDQSYPVSSAQEESQPSPSTKFPSSQYPEAVITTTPSPQISVQTLAVEASPRVHSQLASTAQDAEQPSPVAIPPSSQ